jgi:hypothetical protein
MFRPSSVPVVVLFVVISLTPTAVRAGFAGSVVSYAAGDGIGASYQNPQAALGMPAGDTSFGVLTPFNAAFLGSHIVGIGAGGSLVLDLDPSAATGASAGATIGVHAAVGLIDTDWPNGNAGPVATPYTNARSAEVLVSDNGSRWHSLGSRTFDVPTNFYSQGVTTPGLQMEPGTQVADFTKPFTRPLGDFDGKAWPAILTLLDGSAGGEWLDLSTVPYPAVNFIRFDAGAGQTMYVDAVAVVPEPASLGMLLIGGALLAWRRAS